MKSNFNKFPSIKLRETDVDCSLGWEHISEKLKTKIGVNSDSKSIIIVDLYQGTHEDDIVNKLTAHLHPDHVFLSSQYMLDDESVRELTQNDVTNDRIFGYMSRLNMSQFFDEAKVNKLKKQIASLDEGLILIIGIGASLLTEENHTLVFADMARWEIQLRMRKDKVNNLGINNKTDKFESQYKRAYFVDWRVCDRHKKSLMKTWDFVLDTNNPDQVKMLDGSLVNEGLSKAVKQPFSPVPYFDEGPWGGQWMREVCGLDDDKPNYAWCFNCVPEENSLLFKLGDIKFELPSINVVFHDSVGLLGDAVQARFGDEFPIRLDFLDTMDGGNLSMQVHPTTEYIQEKFGLQYTQDESYYMLDAADDAVVYLGLKEGVDGDAMINDLKKSEKDSTIFPDEKYVEKWPAKKHDHFLIPAGTVHCSGRNGMVLEISSTPYIFTFKLWDWGRLGLDGKPRPINIDHGANVIDWDRTKPWTEENLINQVSLIEEGPDYRAESTGLHEREFIETERHWFKNTVKHEAIGGVQVFNVIEGREILVESADNSFKPMVFHYAETFIIPAAAGTVLISPYGESKSKECATIKAYVRT